MENNQYESHPTTPTRGRPRKLCIIDGRQQDKYEEVMEKTGYSERKGMDNKLFEMEGPGAFDSLRDTGEMNRFSMIAKKPFAVEKGYTEMEGALGMAGDNIHDKEIRQQEPNTEDREKAAGLADLESVLGLGETGEWNRIPERPQTDRLDKPYFAARGYASEGQRERRGYGRQEDEPGYSAGPNRRGYRGGGYDGRGVLDYEPGGYRDEMDRINNVESELFNGFSRYPWNERDKQSYSSDYASQSSQMRSSLKYIRQEMGKDSLECGQMRRPSPVSQGRSDEPDRGWGASAAWNSQGYSKQSGVSARLNSMFQQAGQPPQSQQNGYLDSSSHLYRQPIDLNTFGLLYGARKKRRSISAARSSTYLKGELGMAVPPSKYSSLEFIQGMEQQNARQQRPMVERSRSNYLLPMILESNEIQNEEQLAVLQSYREDVRQLDMENVTVFQLKALMREYGLNHAGKKNELIDLIRDIYHRVEGFDLKSAKPKNSPVENSREPSEKDLNYEKIFF